MVLATILATCVLSGAVTFPQIKRPWYLESMSYSANYSTTQVPDSIRADGPSGTLWLTPTTPVTVVIARPTPTPRQALRLPVGCKLMEPGP